MIKTSTFKIIIEQDEDGFFVASIPAVPGCHSQGATYEEALTNVKEALELCLEVAKKEKSYKAQITFPKNNSKQTFVGIVNLPIQYSL